MIDIPTGDTLTHRDPQSFHSRLDAAKDFDPDLFRNFAFLVAELGETVRAARRLEQATSHNRVGVAFGFAERRSARFTSCSATFCGLRYERRTSRPRSR